MRILIAELDHFGRPVVELYVGLSVAESELRREWGQTVQSNLPVKALIDTGASRTLIEASVLDALGPAAVGEEALTSVTTHGVPLLGRLFAVQVTFADSPPGPHLPNLEVMQADDLSGLGVKALLGRDVLRAGLLVYDGIRGQFTLAVALPPA